MIIVAHPGKPFEFTAKGSTRRKAVLKTYEKEIEDAYVAVDEISRSEISLPDTWDLGHVTDFIRGIVRSVIDPQLKDDEDIFLHGGDRYADFPASFTDSL